MATGEFVVLLDHDDLLTDDALAAVNHQIWLDDTVDYVYSDEDKVAVDGTFFGVFPKPAWSPERFLCQNYCCHISALRRELAIDVGGFRPGYDGAQDYDLVLRVTERARTVVHIPESAVPLENRRRFDRRRSRRQAVRRRRWSPSGGRRSAASRHHRRRRSTPATATTASSDAVDLAPEGVDHRADARNGRPGLGTRRLIRRQHDRQRDQREHLPDIEFVVVYDASMSTEHLAEIERVGDDVRRSWSTTSRSTSRRSAISAHSHASGDVFIFMNDDMEARSPDWIESMIGFLEDPTIGLVGPMLLFDNFLVQSAGHTSAPPGHFARGLPPSVAGGPGWPLALNREVMGVTGACMAIRRETFFDVGGFSVEFPVNYNDVDFGFKVIQSWIAHHLDSRCRAVPLRVEVETDDRRGLGVGAALSSVASLHDLGSVHVRTELEGHLEERSQTRDKGLCATVLSED